MAKNGKKGKNEEAYSARIGLKPDVHAALREESKREGKKMYALMDEVARAGLAAKGIPLPMGNHA